MPARPGLFGKLPAHGDFVRRGLPRSFSAPLDQWLSDGLAALPDACGNDAWDSAGPWRFALAAGRCGPDAAAGVMMPSRDLVGRRFPLALAALLPDNTAWPTAGWYAALEALAATAVAGELDADALAAALPAPCLTGPPAAGDLFWKAGSPPLPMQAGFLALLEQP